MMTLCYDILFGVADAVAAVSLGCKIDLAANGRLRCVGVVAPNLNRLNMASGHDDEGISQMSLKTRRLALVIGRFGVIGVNEAPWMDGGPL